MKPALIAAALAFMAIPAAAQQTPPRVPTGYEVAGCTRYVLVMPEGRVVQVCQPHEDQKANDTNNPLAPIKNKGDAQ